jgi:Tfp pilus assembly protein FimT
MIVVAIMAVVIAMGIPPMVQAMRPQSMRKAVSDLKEVCNTARARAILSGAVAEITFHPKDRSFEVEGAAPGQGSSGRLPADVQFASLNVNHFDYKEAEIAHVRFFPNGTSDEMTVVFLSDKNETQVISLEVTTGLADIDVDFQKNSHK